MNYNTKEQYDIRIKDISDVYESMLIDYKQKYIASKNYINNTNKEQYLVQSSNNLTKKYQELSNLKDEVNSINKNLKGDISDLNSKINIEKQKNTDFKKRLSYLDPMNSSAKMLIGDYKTNYNDKNIQNWSLLIGIIVSVAIITFLFRIPTTKDEMIRVKDDTITKLYKEGSDYAKKYQDLKEIGKRKAAEAETKINNYYEEMKKYRKRADDLVIDRSNNVTNLESKK